MVMVSLESEQREKEKRLRALAESQRVDVIVLRKVSSFAWATGGGLSFVNTAAANGVASLVFGPAGRAVVTTNIEAARLCDEENVRGWDIDVDPWHVPRGALDALTRGHRIGFDGGDPPTEGARDLDAEIARLRASLVGAEGERLREGGSRVAAAMYAAARGVAPGMSEFEVAAQIARECLARETWPIVVQVAADDRARLYRHALPTSRRMQRYVQMGLCARFRGLVLSLSRAIHFGPVPEDLLQKQRAVAAVDQAMLNETAPLAKMSDILRVAAQTYAAEGFMDQWHFHHQGGAVGYEPREYLATPTSMDVVREGQGFAWNPTIEGTKSEDTILVTRAGYEVLTMIEQWPTVGEGPGAARPAIWVR